MRKENEKHLQSENFLIGWNSEKKKLVIIID